MREAKIKRMSVEAPLKICERIYILECERGTRRPKRNWIEDVGYGTFVTQGGHDSIRGFVGYKIREIVDCETMIQLNKE